MERERDRERGGGFAFLRNVPKNKQKKRVCLYYKCCMGGSTLQAQVKPVAVFEDELVLCMCFLKQ